MAITVTGDTASIQWGYYAAVVVGQWHRSGRALSGSVESAHPLWVTQHPLTFVVQSPGATWRWPVRDLQVSGTSFTATIAEV